MNEESLERLGQELTAQGYDLEQLERDSPYNQWMYEDEDDSSIQ